MSDGMRSIGEWIAQAKEARDLRFFLAENEVLTRFYEIFPALQKSVTPISIKKGVITLRVENAALRSELNFRKPEMISVLNNFFNDERVLGIRFSASAKK